MPSLQPNKILILGGKLNFGHSKNVWEYDLREGTVLNKRPLLQEGILTKYKKISADTVLIVGEDTNSNQSSSYYLYCEKYNIKTWQSTVQFGWHLNSKSIEKFKQYNFNQETINIFYQESSVESSHEAPKDYALMNVLFGTDEEPFQIDIHSQTGQLDILPIKTDLKLLNFQGCCRVSDSRLIFAGGINVNYKKISQAAFSYDLATKTIKRLPSMLHLRYTFPLVRFKGHVYALGGREYGNDSLAILRQCERFDLSLEKWEAIPKLNVSRCTSSAFVFRD